MSPPLASSVVRATLVALAVGMAAPTAEAWDWEVHGTLGPGDPTFNRPSTTFPPCTLSTNGTDVYYDLYTDYFPGGYAYIEITGTINRPVIATYPAGTFNPASACDNIHGVGGCMPLPIAAVTPIFEEAGSYDIVVTHCYNGDSGSYNIYLEAFLFRDGFESGDLTAWSSWVGKGTGKLAAGEPAR